MGFHIFRSADSKGKMEEKNIRHSFLLYFYFSLINDLFWCTPKVTKRTTKITPKNTDKQRIKYNLFTKDTHAFGPLENQREWEREWVVQVCGHECELVVMARLFECFEHKLMRMMSKAWGDDHKQYDSTDSYVNTTGR